MYTFIFVVVVIESVFDDMSWATPSGRSETVVTPGSIACTMVAHSPKSDVGQMTKTPCDTSAGDLLLF